MAHAGVERSTRTEGQVIRDEFQKAIYDILVAADFGLNDPAIYDYVPTNEPYPIVALGDIDYRSWQSDDENNYRGEIRIHAYSDKLGRRQVNEILDVIDAALDRAELSMDNGHVITIDRIFSTTDIEVDSADRQIRSGRIDFSFLIGRDT